MPATAELLPPPPVEQPQNRIANYSVTDAEIAAIRERATGLKPDTPKTYELVRSTIAECRSLRVAVEKRRKDLKADALEWGRIVDSEAKRITAALEEIESPLQTAKDAVDAERERVRREKEEAIRRQIEEAAAQKRAAEEARLKAEREAEEQRLAEERARLEAERQKLEAERKAAEERERIERQKIEAERAAAEKERNRLAAEAESERRKAQAEEEARQAKVRAEQQAREQAERERLAEERRALEAERAKLAAEEAARQAAIRAEQEAKERAERERIEAERRATEEAELKARREALKPDVEKLTAWAGVIRSLPRPTVKDVGAKKLVATVAAELEAVAKTIEAWNAA